MYVDSYPALPRPPAAPERRVGVMRREREREREREKRGRRKGEREKREESREIDRGKRWGW